MINLQTYRRSHVTKSNVAVSAAYIRELLEGQVVLASASGKVMSNPAGTYTGSEYKEVSIFQRKNGKLLKGYPMQISNIKSISVTPYVAPTLQKYYVGYNGTTGSIEDTVDVVAGKTYTLTVRRMELIDGEYNECLDTFVFPSFEDVEVLTRAMVVDGILSSASAQLSVPENAFIEMWRICNGTAGTAIPNTKLYFGSRTATFASAHGYTLANIGQYVRIGTEKVYKIVAIPSTITVQLDCEWLGDDFSGNFTPLTVAADTKWGIGIITRDKYFEVGVYPFDAYQFQLFMSESFTANTIVTKVSEANLGNGSYKEIAQLEYEDTRSFAPSQPMDIRIKEEPLNADSTLLYDIVTIKLDNKATGHVITADIPKAMTIHLAVQTTNKTEAVKIVGVLEKWCVDNGLTIELTDLLTA